jgi:hypothetical protein
MLTNHLIEHLAVLVYVIVLGCDTALGSSVVVDKEVTSFVAQRLNDTLERATRVAIKEDGIIALLDAQAALVVVVGWAKRNKAIPTPLDLIEPIQNLL